MTATFIDVFSGAGGSALGFVRAGLRLVGALELYAPAARTFEGNLGVRPVLADARGFDFARWGRELGDVDVVVGCPPCQGFSRLRRCYYEGCADPRNDLVFTYLKAVEGLRPSVAVFENVDWMARRAGKAYLESLMERLSRLGYRVAYRVLDARDYGVPQRRRRLILIASRRGAPRLPPPTHGPPGSPAVREGLLRPWATVRDAIADLPPIGPGESHPGVPNHVAKPLPENWLRLIRAIPKDGGSRRDAPRGLWLPAHRKHDGYWDVFGRLAWDGQANTITTGCWNPSKGRFVHPEQDRSLSLRECARLQGFPDDYVFHGRPSSVARQIGEALPPPLAEKVAQAILQLF